MIGNMLYDILDVNILKTIFYPPPLIMLFSRDIGYLLGDPPLPHVILNYLLADPPPPRIGIMLFKYSP